MNDRYLYHFFFRRKKGGCGIPYETARAEFDIVFKDAFIEMIEEYWARHRLIAALTPDPRTVARRAALMGYVEAVLSVRDEPYQGEELTCQQVGRYIFGWIRSGDIKRYQQGVYFCDEEARINVSPDKRPFGVEVDGELFLAKGHKHRRGLSPLDAKFLLNLAGSVRGDIILDPFAGFGSIVIEARSRGIEIIASDRDVILRPGLGEVSDGACLFADARYLPFRDNTFDAVVTEPPYGRNEVDDVIKSLPELDRVVKPEGKIVILATEGMSRKLAETNEKIGRNLLASYPVRRHGGMMCRAMLF